MPKKSTKEEFIQKAIEIHGDKYNYDKVEYINNSTKVKIYCKRCEEYFEQIPHSHLSENGCPICGNSLKLTKETFIKKAIEIHGDKYNYDKVEYINSKSNILIYCNTHKKYFEQTPTNHLNKKGCSICGNTERRLKSIKRIEENKLNGNQLYPGFNKNACKLFDEISLNENIHIQHAMNGGEYHIKELGYWVDGYDNVNNVVYEFDEKYHNKEKQQEKDKIRQQEIENFLGCTFIRIKEN